MNDLAPSSKAGGVLTENLAALAEYAFRTAAVHCTDCALYHALWSYERLSGVRGNGFETDREILASLFRNHAGENSRVLIAGAADAGLLALMAQSLDPSRPHITVADRCATPLHVCTQYAATHALPVGTLVTDLISQPLSGKYELAFTHNLLRHLPRDRHVAFLRNLRDALTPGGVLILAHSLPAAPTPGVPLSHYAARIFEALSSQGIGLPESEDRFRSRLEAYVESQPRWLDAIISPDHVERVFDTAGFRIVRRIDHERRTSVPDRDGGATRPTPAHIFVAEPA